MRYQVPQFIEVEDKIFGSLTIKQFLYIAGGASLAFILWTLLPKFIAPFIAIPILGLFIGFAFYKYNDRPLIYAVENGFKYFFGTKLYIWKKDTTPKKKKGNQKDTANKTVEQLNIPKLSDSKLKEISWSLDINEKI